MHLVTGSTIAAAVAGLVASIALHLVAPTGSGIFAMSSGTTALTSAERMDILTPFGPVPLEAVHYAPSGEPSAYTLRIETYHRLPGSSRTGVPVIIAAARVLQDTDRNQILIAMDETSLLALQRDAAVPVEQATGVPLAGAPVITDRGHVFGRVERVRHEANSGRMLHIRLAGAGGGDLMVPQACASVVPETGLVVVRTCDLAQI